MKYIQRCLITIPNQVLSTFIVALLLVGGWRAIVSFWESPPTPRTIAIVLFTGIVLGLVAGFVPDVNEKNPDNKPVEKDNIGN